ncbi:MULTISPECIES: DUF3560 domain-containing protein [unclassified Crossiella]|uniref:DUF3560 domain-containing protein n=1 Tax=unclassified Crossiella TaxID=2620835 RepID=UPI001FFF859F|nr:MULTISPECIES: DUF3560 domain-containing protein [unclassified Crossiella]MCK2241857.1 DUF3560 domain-containing protein [Crossiella sp. S99.2]MCK2255760.1 DUF3560 domain-containing protein [Crossiella sp. S99.1]
MNTENFSAPAGESGTRELTIWHSYEQGTILGGTSKGDRAGELLGRAGLGWKWSRHIVTPDGDDGAWYIRRSRDKPARRGQIEHAAEHLRQAGYRVAVHLDTTPRDMHVSEAERADRMHKRAEALQAKAAGQNNTAASLAEQAECCFPDNGQPLLVGHHSYKRDLRRRERGWTKLGQSAELAVTAEHTSRRANTARKHMQHRQDPLRVTRRIRTLEAELRRWQHALNGDHDQPADTAVHDGREGRHPTPEWVTRAREEMAHIEIENQFDHWRAMRQQHLADGTANDYGPDKIKKGDFVQDKIGWAEVVRVNKKSVTINFMPMQSGVCFTSTVRYDQIRDHRVNRRG